MEQFYFGTQITVHCSNYIIKYFTKFNDLYDEFKEKY